MNLLRLRLRLRLRLCLARDALAFEMVERPEQLPPRVHGHEACLRPVASEARWPGDEEEGRADSKRGEVRRPDSKGDEEEGRVREACLRPVASEPLLALAAVSHRDRTELLSRNEAAAAAMKQRELQ